MHSTQKKKKIADVTNVDPGTALTEILNTPTASSSAPTPTFEPYISWVEQNVINIDLNTEKKVQEFGFDNP